MRIGVVGAGTMGAGIAQVALQYGHHVSLYDQDRDALARAGERIAHGLQGAVDRGKLSAEDRELALGRMSEIENLSDLAGMVIVVEAIAESLPAKRAVFTALDAVLAPEAILASNTSSLSITALASATSHPQRVVGMHFFNPAPAMRLVEIVPGVHTARSVVNRTTELARELGKTPVESQNRPGFIVNRVASPFSGEALRLLDEDVASPETIDALVKAMGFRMGPFELMDLVGLDIGLAVSTAMYEATFGESRFRPHPLQTEMVDAGLLGRKAGKGFYEHRSR